VCETLGPCVPCLLADFFHEYESRAPAAPLALLKALPGILNYTQIRLQPESLLAGLTSSSCFVAISSTLSWSPTSMVQEDVGEVLMALLEDVSKKVPKDMERYVRHGA
jgi:hypothetical protein